MGTRRHFDNWRGRSVQAGSGMWRAAGLASNVPQRPGGYQFQEQRQGLGRDALSRATRPIQYVTSVWPPAEKLAMLPARR
jgi:hypothetical protein